MNQRWYWIVAGLLCMPSFAAAQGVMLAPPSGPDPYAMTTTSSSPYWWGNGFAYPTTSCFRDRIWVTVDYLHLWTEGMDAPPLVTSSPIGPPDDTGAIGLPSTSVLYGGTQLNDGSANGLRLRSGMWFRQGAWGIESEFYRVTNSTESFSASSDGSTILARPYFDIVSGEETSRLIAYPNLVSGSVAVSSQSRLESGLINLRASLIPIGMLGCNDGCDPPDRVDWIVGYRVVNLEDDFAIGDNRNALNAVDPDTQVSGDQFSTENRFNGLQLGVVYQTHYRRLTTESLLRIALGNNRRTASIVGGTTITDAGVSNSYAGGLLAQRSNIGSFQEDEFTMIPELGFNLGFRVTRCLHATLGYNVLYFPGVLRASAQIDTDVNPQLIPVEAANVTGALRPKYRGIEDNYWAQGLNVGAELRF